MASDVTGLRVTVQGDLPDTVMTSVAEAVRHAVLDAIAGLDIAPALHEVPLRTDAIAARLAPAGDPAPAGDEAVFGDEPELLAEGPIDLIPILLGIWFTQTAE